MRKRDMAELFGSRSPSFVIYLEAGSYFREFFSNNNNKKKSTIGGTVVPDSEKFIKNDKKLNFFHKNK